MPSSGRTDTKRQRVIICSHVRCSDCKEYLFVFVFVTLSAWTWILHSIILGHEFSSNFMIYLSLFRWAVECNALSVTFLLYHSTIW